MTKIYLLEILAFFGFVSRIYGFYPAVTPYTEYYAWRPGCRCCYSLPAVASNLPLLDEMVRPNAKGTISEIESFEIHCERLAVRASNFRCAPKAESKHQLDRNRATSVPRKRRLFYATVIGCPHLAEKLQMRARDRDPHTSIGLKVSWCSDLPPKPEAPIRDSPGCGRLQSQQLWQRLPSRTHDGEWKVRHDGRHFGPITPSILASEAKASAEPSNFDARRHCIRRGQIARVCKATR